MSRHVRALTGTARRRLVAARRSDEGAASAFGRYVAHEGETEAAAREAVRAATLERDESSAVLAAQAAAEATLADHLDCRPVVLRGAFVAGGTLTAEVTCTVSWHDLGVIGLGGTVDVAGASSAPIDLYRRTGGP